MTNLQLVENANYQIVHEVYDLLSNPEGQSMTVLNNDNKTEWLLTKPSFTQPLRKMRFSTFRPIYKPGFTNRTHSATMTITPRVVEYDNSKFSEIPLNQDSLYSESETPTKNEIKIPIIPQTFNFNFDGTFENLSHEINDFIGNYFGDLYTEGKICFDHDEKVYRSEASLDAIITKAIDDGAIMTRGDEIFDRALILFNTMNVITPYDESEIKITNIWVRFKDTNYYLVFTFDLDTNWHSFSIDTGILLSSMFSSGELPLHGTSYYFNGLTPCNYDTELSLASVAVMDSGLTISLCSSYAGNLSGKIFTGENLYHTVDIETFPSSMYFPITIKDKNNNVVPIEDLKLVYDQITVGVDYVYLTY